MNNTIIPDTIEQTFQYYNNQKNYYVYTYLENKREKILHILSQGGESMEKELKTIIDLSTFCDDPNIDTEVLRAIMIGEVLDPRAKGIES